MMEKEELKKRLCELLSDLVDSCDLGLASDYGRMVFIEEKAEEIMQLVKEEK